MRDAFGEALLELEDQSTLKFRTRVKERDIAHIEIGQEMTVTIDALDDLRLAGTVSTIIPSGDISTHEFTVEATLPPQDRLYHINKYLASLLLYDLFCIYLHFLL